MKLLMEKIARAVVPLTPNSIIPPTNVVSPLFLKPCFTTPWYIFSSTPWTIGGGALMFGRMIWVGISSTGIFWIWNWSIRDLNSVIFSLGSELILHKIVHNYTLYRADVIKKKKYVYNLAYGITLTYLIGAGSSLFLNGFGCSFQTAVARYFTSPVLLSIIQCKLTWNLAQMNKNHL